MDRKLAQTVISRAVKENEKVKISCRDAFKIADEFRVDPAIIGRICNEQKIRICKCQLGCFK